MSATGGNGGKERARRVLVSVLLVASAGVTCWPVAESFRHVVERSTEVSAYSAQMSSTPLDERRRDVARARAYNDALGPGPLTDPWGDRGTQASTAHDAYLRLLGGQQHPGRKVAGQNVIGRIRIPAITVDLPIRHDADEASLAKGVGHMYGSSLPVGGPGSHAVLAAHTGFRGRTFFDRLPELNVGNTFGIEVAGAASTYRVDRKSVVEPWQLEAVARVPGADHVTLVTCYTPPGRHKMRLLVRGTRTDGEPAPTQAPAAAALSATQVDPAGERTGTSFSIHGWMCPRLAAAGLALLLLGILAVRWQISDRAFARER